MDKDYKIIDKLLKGTKNFNIVWISNGRSDYYTKIRIRDTKKYIRFDIGTRWRKGRYERTLTIRYFNGMYNNDIKTIFANRYTQIYNLEKLIKRKL